MKASLKQALSIGLMAGMLLPGFLAANADTEKPSPDAAEKKDDKKSAAPAAAPASTAAKTSDTKDSGPYAEVNARMLRFERRLVEDLATGRLSPQKTADFQKSLEQVQELEAQFRMSPVKFTHWQNVRLQTLLDKLHDSLDQSEHDRDLASADLQFTREDLWHRIDLAARQNKLSPQEVADLKQRFNRINALEAMLQRQHEKLTYVDKLMLCVDYDHLGTRLSHAVSQRPLAMPDVAAGGSDIEKRLEEGTKAGKISDAQAKEIKDKLAEMRSKEAAAKKTPLDSEQIVVLGLEMDALANKIEVLIDPKSEADIDTRLNLIDRKVAVSVEEGGLTPLETLELKEDIDEIHAEQSKMSSGGNLKAEDEQALKLDIARLEGRLERQLHGPSRIWSGFAIGIVHLSHRNKQAADAKRVTDDEAKAFRQDLRELNKKRVEYKKAEGGMTCEQALQIAEDGQRLSGRLEKTMKDRVMDLPNIDGIKQTLESRIGDDTMTGRLNVGDARTLVLSLAEMNSVKERYSTSDSTLDTREKFSLAFELERMICNLEEQMHEHDASFPGVDTRRAQIEALINEGVSSGRLNAVSADLYRQKLQENSKLEKQYRGDSVGLTGDKALELVTSLEHLWEQLDRELREKQVSTADIVSLEGNVEKKIRQGFSYGLLSPAEADNLRKSFDGVVASFNTMRAEEGGLSYGERLAFSYGFQRLAAHVERNLRSSPLQLPSLEAQRAMAEQKIANLLATGRLPVQEAQDLKALLDEIAKSAAEKHASGGGMSYQEGLIVAVDLSRIDRRIEQRAAALKSPLPDVDSLQQAADKRIEEAKKKGTISAAQYKAYKADLDRISSNEAAFRISDESLSYAEAINLILELQRLHNEVEAPTKVTPVTGGKKKEAASEKKDGAASKPKTAAQK